MTKTFKASGREYQRSPHGNPDGVLSNPLARELYTAGSFDVTSETTRGQLKDLTANFTNANHLGRLVIFPMGTALTPPSGGTSGTRLHDGWTFRIKTVVSTTIVELEGFRSEVTGSGIHFTIPASVDFAAASGHFPQDTGPTGTNADTTNRSNTGPIEWQSISFPVAADPRLRMYPFVVSGWTSGTAVRLTDQFDNIATFPTESTLTWFLRDSPAYTSEQLFKIIDRFLRQTGWALLQHRGNNNGVQAGGNGQANIYCVHDMVYKSLGEDGNQSMVMRMAMFNRGNINDGSDNQGVMGIDFAMFSAWDRAYNSLAIAGTTATSNQGNGINALRAHINNTDNFAAGDHINTTVASPAIGPIAAGPGFGPFNQNARWSHPKSITTPATIQNTLNTPEGGDIAEIRYYLFGDKDEVHIIIEGIGSGYGHIGFGGLKPRPDSNPNNWKTNFSATNGSNVLLHVGGPSRGSAGGALAGASDGNNPATVVPPYVVGDRIQTVGQKVITSPLIVPGTSFSGELIDSSTISNLPGSVQAIGILITDTVANIADGSTFLIDDGLALAGSTQTYEFNKAGGVGGGNIAVDLITGAPTTADQVRDRVRDAINPLLTANYTWNGTTTVTSPDTTGVLVDDWIWLTSTITNQLFRITSINPNVSVTIDNPDSFTIPSGSGANTTRKAKHGIKATNAASARVDLTNGRKGGTGNVLIVDSNSEFLAGTEGMSGGGYAIEITTLNSSIVAGALVGEDPQPMFFFRPALFATPFSSTGGTQGVFRVSNRSNNADGTYRDHNGPTAASGQGFDCLAELAGLFGPDTREINPNERTGRFSAVTISCRDTAGGQIRGSMRYCKVTSPRLGAYSMRRDRNGDWYMMLPFTGRFRASGSEITSDELIVAIGPMPNAMAFLS